MQRKKPRELAEGLGIARLHPHAAPRAMPRKNALTTLWGPHAVAWRVITDIASMCRHARYHYLPIAHIATNARTRCCAPSVWQGGGLHALMPFARGIYARQYNRAACPLDEHSKALHHDSPVAQTIGTDTAPWHYALHSHLSKKFNSIGIFTRCTASSLEWPQGPLTITALCIRINPRFPFFFEFVRFFVWGWHARAVYWFAMHCSC